VAEQNNKLLINIAVLQARILAGRQQWATVYHSPRSFCRKSVCVEQ